MGTAQDHLDVPGDIVLVARMDLQFDVLVGLGLGQARLDAVLEGVEAPVDGRGHLRVEHRTVQSGLQPGLALFFVLRGVVHRIVMARLEHEPQRPRFQGHAAAENASPAHQHAVLLGIGRGIDHDRPLGQRQQVAVMHSVLDGHLSQPGFQQIAAPQAGRFALRRARGRRRRSGRPSAPPAGKMACTITSETSPEASTAVGLATPRVRISSNSAARCGEGTGSLPVPFRPVTNPTASTRTGESDWISGTAMSPTSRARGSSGSGSSGLCERIVSLNQEHPPRIAAPQKSNARRFILPCTLR